MIICCRKVCRGRQQREGIRIRRRDRYIVCRFAKEMLIITGRMAQNFLWRYMENRNRMRTQGKRTNPSGRRENSRGNQSGEERRAIDTAAQRRPAADEAERRRRRKRAMRARRERELRRQKRILLAACAAGAVVVLVCAVRGITFLIGSRAAAGTAESTASVSEATDTAESVPEDGTASDEAARTDSNAPYAFVETDRTVDLGESLTDISIYDAQRGITTTTSGETAQETGDTAESATEETSAEDTSAEGESTDSSSAKASNYVDSQYAILVNATTGEILAERRAFERMVPASMTKVMTLLVAVEAMEDPEASMKDTVTITQEICDEAYLSGSSFVGYGVGDTATVEDLLYGTILPSGADAAMALAEYTAGSQEAFAEKMNEKARELGIAETTHFTNCVGLYNENHYSTAYDMAVIMRAAVDNDLCRTILSTHTWTTAAFKDNPDGSTISNWFLRRIEDHPTGGTVLCGKTGFVNESGNCAVSYEVGDDGNDYIACTALTYNLWRCIYDHVALYKEYT